MIIELGCLAKPLHEQLSVPPASVEKFQLITDAISLLGIQGILTDAEKGRARDRLMKKLQKHLRAK